ncbi:hypothetical protein CASFOL_019261 [Castilleja foliolosa]|uniref:Uncharacterized protein n=1 Tax=Castilleja foliolosa TaxID=1961234 RepID=A0ABD3D891_9LAMI
MARGGPIARRRKTRNNKVRLEKNSSDESDEDYTVGEDELVDTEDEYCSSLAADDETEESLEELEEDDQDDEDEELKEGWVNMNVNKAVKHVRRNSYRRRNNNGVVRPRKGDDDEDDEDEELEEGWVDMNIKKAVKPIGRNSYRRRNNGVVIPRKEDDEDVELEEGWVNMKNNKSVKPIGHNSYQRRRNNGDVIPRKKKPAYVSDDDDDDDFSLCPKEKGDNSTSILYRQEVVNLRDEKSRKRTRVSSTEKSRNKAVVSYREERADGESGNSDEENSDEEFAPDEVDDDDDEDDEESLVMEKNNEVCLSAHIGNRKKRKRNVEAWRKNKRKKPINGKKFQDDIRRKGKVTEKGRRKKTNANSDPDFVSSDYEYTISEEEREQIREAVFCRRSTTSLLTFDSLKMNEEEEEAEAASQRKRQEMKGKEKVADTKKIELCKQVCGICLSKEGKRSVRGILNCCSHFFCFACIMEWSKVESRCPLCKQRFVTISRTACSDGSKHLLKDDAVIPIPERDQVYKPSEEELRGYLQPYENVLCSECHYGGDDALMLLCDLCDSPAHTYCVGLGHEVPEGSWYCDGCRPTALLSSPISQSLNNNSNYYNNNNPTHPDHGGNNNNGSSSSPARETFDLNEMYVPETPLTQINREQSSPSRYFSGDPIPAATTLFERRRIHHTVQQLFNNRGTRSEWNVAGINLFGPRIVSQQAPQAQVAGPQSIYNYNQDYRLYGREGLRHEFNHRESTSTDYYAYGRVSHGELSGIGQQQLHPCNSRSNTGAEIGYNNFMYVARTSTHTILAVVGLEHRCDEVYLVRTRPLMCNYFDRLDGGQQTYPVKGQC